MGLFFNSEIGKLTIAVNNCKTGLSQQQPRSTDRRIYVKTMLLHVRIDVRYTNLRPKTATNLADKIFLGYSNNSTTCYTYITENFFKYFVR